MKKTFFKLSITVIFIILMLLIPKSINAETNYEFSYSLIRALDGQTPKYYELDIKNGIIESQNWYYVTDTDSIILMESTDTFEIGKKYKYIAKIKLAEADFIDVVDFPMIEGAEVNISRDGEYILVEITAMVPKKFVVTTNVSEGIVMPDEQWFQVYEMEEVGLDLKLADGYEIDYIKANGNEVFSELYFENTFIKLYPDKISIWDINTDVVLDIVAKPIPTIETVDINLTMNNVKIGDKVTDLEIYVEDELIEVSELKVGELLEENIEGGLIPDDLSFGFIPVEGVFQQGKHYAAYVRFKSNLDEWYDKDIIFFMDGVDIEYLSLLVTESTIEPIILIRLPELEESLSAPTVPSEGIPEGSGNLSDSVPDNSVPDNSVASKDEKDESPKTGANLNIIYAIIGIAMLGVIVTGKK